MAELFAKTPCAGLLPLTIGGVTLVEETAGPMTAVAPFKGKADALGEAMKAAHGMGFPAPGRATGKAGSRAIWFGREMALLLGVQADASLADHAALTDQSDGWAVVKLEGEQAAEVLARLTPLDLRAAVFKRGHTARTEVAHMMGSITKTGENAFLVMVFRSMARTLVHDLKTAMEAVAARG